MNKGIKVLWLISIAASFFMGYFVSPTTKSNQSTTSSILIEQPEINDINAPEEHNIHLPEAEKTEKLNPPALVKPDFNVLVINLKDLLGGGGFSFDMASIAEAYKLIENLSEVELLTTLNLIKGGLNKTNNVQLLSLLIGRLATFDPTEAINFIEKHIDKPQIKMAVMMSALSSWVQEDPLSAYYWYMDPNNNDLNNTLTSMGLVTIFNGLAASDPNSAFDKLIELNDSGKNTSIAAIGFCQSLENKKDFIQFIERSDELNNLKIKKSILTNWVLQNPLDAIEWSNSIEDQEQKKELQNTIFTAWSSTEPANAANWFIEKANESEKQSRATEIIETWNVHQDPKAALSWLDQQTTFDTQSSLIKLLNSSIYTNPKFAMDNLDRLTSAKDKANISFRIYQSLQRESMEKAVKFLESSPYQEVITQKKQRIEKYNK
jgi:hypothetical protein